MKLRRKQVLTEKQKLFIEKVNNGVTPVIAAESIYKTKNRNSARVISSRLLSHQVIYETVRQALDSDCSKARAIDIARVIEDGLAAERVIVTKKGEVITVPDHKVRLFAAQLALRVRGELQEMPEDTSPKDIRVTFHLVKARSQQEIARLTSGTSLENMRGPEL